MKTFRVTYEIDVDAENPVDAAKHAHDLITGPDGGSLYTFDVLDRENADRARVTLGSTGELVEISGVESTTRTMLWGFVESICPPQPTVEDHLAEYGTDHEDPQL